MEIHHDYNSITAAKVLGRSASRITSLVDLHLLIQIFFNPLRMKVIARKGSNILNNKKIFYMQLSYKVSSFSFEDHPFFEALHRQSHLLLTR